LLLGRDSEVFMRARCLWTTTVLVATLAWPTTGRGQGQAATWLDQPRPASWNTPGLTIPAAPNIALEGQYWKAIELAGKPTPAQDPQREAHLQFQAGGRVSGSDGCNRLTGTYQRSGDRLTFGQMAGTQMACLDAPGIEEAFRDALKNVARFAIDADRLEFFDASGARLAVFSATTAPPSRPSRIERLRARSDNGSAMMRSRTGGEIRP
jgi:heat shock protein HslJ